MPAEAARFVGREDARADRVDRAGEAGVVLDRLVGVALDRAAGDDLLGGHAEEEEVLGPHLLADLHVRAVERADGERAVERELHVAGARGFLAGGRDLFGQVGGGDQLLGEADVVVRNGR